MSAQATGEWNKHEALRTLPMARARSSSAHDFCFCLSLSLTSFISLVDGMPAGCYADVRNEALAKKPPGTHP